MLAFTEMEAPFSCGLAKRGSQLPHKTRVQREISNTHTHRTNNRRITTITKTLPGTPDKLGVNDDSIKNCINATDATNAIKAIEDAQRVVLDSVEFYKHMFCAGESKPEILCRLWGQGAEKLIKQIGELSGHVGTLKELEGSIKEEESIRIKHWNHKMEILDQSATAFKQTVISGGDNLASNLRFHPSILPARRNTHAE